MKKHERISKYIQYFTEHYDSESEHWYFTALLNKNNSPKYVYKLYSFKYSEEDIIEKLKIFGFEIDDSHIVKNIDEKTFEKNKHLLIANELGLL